MINYVLTVDERGNVPYIMKQPDCAVASRMPKAKAQGILATGKPHVSDVFGGYPITSDDIYFFQGEYEEDENEVVIGADGAPIPAKGERKSRKRIKDVVCE